MNSANPQKQVARALCHLRKDGARISHTLHQDRVQSEEGKTPVNKESCAADKARPLPGASPCPSVVHNPGRMEAVQISSERKLAPRTTSSKVIEQVRLQISRVAVHLLFESSRFRSEVLCLETDS